MLPSESLDRIREGIAVAAPILRRFASDGFRKERKDSGDWVTEADLEVDRVLRETLLQDGEGWLSEETRDEPSRLDKSVVWIVDPLDGTREFVLGIPEWCVSIGLAIDGKAVAGGICNPVSGLEVVGAIGEGCWAGGEPCRVREGSAEATLEVLASRSEMKRGEWDGFTEPEYNVVPTGSVAYKFARVAEGTTDVTWTLTPKNEWDVAAGVALVRAAGGEVILKDGSEPTFNRPDTLFPGLVASSKERVAALRPRLGIDS